ncbi:MAG: alpha/beta fold hydrolase [Anaerolineae bacterium]|nr:alpha/beta fold hydrolase [Anaerolineae bacterium]
MQRDQQYWIRLARFAAVALAAGLATAYVGTAVLSGAIYAHALTHPGCGDTGTTPADVGIEGAQDAAYPTHDGMILQAWYLPPQNGVVIILLPGLSGGRDGMLREGAILARHGYGLLMTEMRSCTHPEGQTTLGYHEAEDLKGAVTWVLDQPGVAHVGVLGYSLGGITATLGAAKDERIEAVVAEGGFYDLAADVTNEGGTNSLWETIMFQTILVCFRLETGVNAHDVSPISAIDRISPQPLLLIYGELEVGETHPQEQLVRAGEPKELWIVPGCWHGGYLDVAAEEWEQRVVAFFDSAFGLSEE